MAIFTPSNEWQFVPENVAIPGGLEIKMDLDKGGRWARILDRSAESDNTVAVAPVPLTYEDLDVLEDKAHSYDDGAEIAQEHGDSLYNIFSNPQSQQRDQAGRILSICLRNNDEATRQLIKTCPQLPSALNLDKRSLSILSAYVSTKEGLLFVKSHGTLDDMRKTLARATTSTIDDTTSKSLSKLLQDLAIAGEDSQEMSDWVAAIQQAYFVTQNAGLKQLALDIVGHNGDFESLDVQVNPQPGLLSSHHEQKRAVESAQKYANPKAARNHFDAL